MKASIMKSKLKTVSKIIIPLLFWLFVWEILSLIVAYFIGTDHFLPSVPRVFKALVSLFQKWVFYKSVLLTLLRVIFGLVLGIVLGVVLATLSHKFEYARIIISPFMSVVKATPVATFIIVLWVLFTKFFSAGALAVFIAVLMVMPIIWQNTLDAYNSIDIRLSEVCDVFEFGFKKRVKLLVFPAVTKFIFPAVITATGLAWKSEIAAEIIAYTKYSIGQKINDAKEGALYDEVFALTLVIIVMSLLLEFGVKKLLSRYTK